MNKINEFTLVLTGVGVQTEHLEDQLFEAGCDDALVHFRYGTVYLDFSREAASFENAVISAIQAVETSNPNIKVINVLPDSWVSETEIAKRLKKSRQVISLWIKKERRTKFSFPHPVLKLTEKSPLWRWYDILQWTFQQHIIKNRQDIEELLNKALFIENINVVLTERDSKVSAYRHQILKKLNKIPFTETENLKKMTSNLTHTDILQRQ